MAEPRSISRTSATQSPDAAAVEITTEVDETRPVGARDEELSRDRTSGAVKTGDALGRYMILRPLGSGGMSNVYVAYDPELNREVALKVMRPGGENQEAAGDRLLREAQAMAQLEHVNVARVYDVGVVDGRVYMAMELVRGENLEEWLARKKPSINEIVRVMIRAGRGLAAAHAAGLVHLDFKPRNVMVGDDGEVRVVDFGLARPPRTEDKPFSVDPEVSGDSHANSRLSDQVTMFGLVMGTPGYMAPEQLAGGLADARTDQFAFCVTMWSALYGQRPFRGKGATDLNAAVLRAKIDPPPSGAHVPAWIRRLLERGLSHHAAERFASMHALLSALQNDPAVRRRKIAMGVAIVGLLGVAAWGTTRSAWMSGPSCDRAIEHLQGVWDDDRRSQIAHAFARDPRPFVGDTLEKIGARLDEYANAWVTMHDDSCLATHRRGEQSTEMLDLRTQCLMDRLAELRAATDVLSQADETIVEGAVQVVDALPRIDACADLERLRRTDVEPDDPQVREQVEHARALIRHTRVLDHAGKYPAALVLATSAFVVAESTGHIRTIAEARAAYTSILYEYGDAISAERFAHLALQAAEVAGDDRARAGSMMDLMFLTGMMQGRVDEAGRWARIAEAVIARAGNDPEHLIRLYSGEAALAGTTGDAERSIALFTRALDTLEKNGVDDEEARSSIYLGLGAAYYWTNRYEEALPYYETSRRIMQERVGVNHPRTATSTENLGALYHALGRYEDAYPLLMHAFEVSEGSDIAPERLGTLYNSIGAALEGLERYEEAERWFIRAAQIIEDKDVKIPVLGIALVNRAGTLVLMKRPREAIPLYERGLAIMRETLVPDAILLSFVECQQANAHLALGEIGEALALLPAAIDRYEGDDPSHDPLYRGECRVTFAQALAEATPAHRTPAVQTAARDRTPQQWAAMAERDLTAASTRAKDGLRRLQLFRDEHGR